MFPLIRMEVIPGKSSFAQSLTGANDVIKAPLPDCGPVTEVDGGAVLEPGHLGRPVLPAPHHAAQRDLRAGVVELRRRQRAVLRVHHLHQGGCKKVYRSGSWLDGVLFFSSWLDKNHSVREHSLADRAGLETK